MKTEIDILARTLYGEARGELNRLDGGLGSLIAVGNVILNRRNQQKWYGKTISEVCLKPWQFSCWNPDDPNSKVLNGPLSGKVFNICLDVAQNLEKGTWPDITQGCDHYHSMRLQKFPAWTLKVKPKFKIGQHLFYDLR